MNNPNIGMMTPGMTNSNAMQHNGNGGGQPGGSLVDSLFNVNSNNNNNGNIGNDNNNRNVGNCSMGNCSTGNGNMGVNIGNLRGVGNGSEYMTGQHSQNQNAYNITRSNSDKNTTRNLVKNINKFLDDYEPSKIQTDEDTNTNIEVEADINTDIKHDKKKFGDDYTILNNAKEAVLLIIIYVILSQGFVRKTIGSFIPQINTTSDGSIMLVGYLIYGSLMALLFIFFKNALLK